MFPGMGPQIMPGSVPVSVDRGRIVIRSRSRSRSLSIPDSVPNVTPRATAWDSSLVEFIYWETEEGTMIDATCSFSSKWGKVSFLSFTLPEISPKPTNLKGEKLKIEDELTWKAFHGSLLAKIRSSKELDRTMLCIGIIKLNTKGSTSYPSFH
ncbi:hypothetical protein Hypma_009239 [Hypsizygus marmoreus]|uniref:Uncharacterized protein n=1 Tax=Hypsizygus marmoreus TaxID=39966 RepID=A0A369JUZ5_HYPMA|nr:hypothetical protein Hypma_009239 [Hypsizygus marmoreus]